MFVGLNMSGSTHFKMKERRFLGEIEILDEHVLSQKGCYKRVKRWLQGKYPELGTLHLGYSGWETIQEIDVITATHVFTVTD